MIKFQIPKNIKIENLELKYSKLLINYYKNNSPIIFKFFIKWIFSNHFVFIMWLI